MAHFDGKEDANQSFAQFLGELETQLGQNEASGKPPEKPAALSMSGFLVKLVQYLKNNLSSLQSQIYSTATNSFDADSRQRLVKSTAERMREVDTVLNALLNFINLHQPVEKVNSVHIILEEILEEYRKRLEEKKISVFKKFQGDLPEIMIHDQKLKYILDSIFQYVLLALPVHGKIGLITKSLPPQEGAEPHKVLPLKTARTVDIQMLLGEVLIEPTSAEPKGNSSQKEPALNLIFLLVKHFVHRHEGAIDWQVDRKNRQTIISLKFPAERRKVVYYQFKS